MIAMLDFLPGIARLAIASRQAIDDATFEVYRDALGVDLEPAEWDAFTVHCIRQDRFPTWFPRVSEIRDALREYRGEPRLDVDAIAAYDRVLTSGDYSPSGGTTWSFRSVRERCGPAAADAFMEAGGHNAFATTWDEAKRRERFVSAYIEAVRADPGSRLLPPASEAKALPSGDGPRFDLEARGLWDGDSKEAQPSAGRGWRRT